MWRIIILLGRIKTKMEGFSLNGFFEADKQVFCERCLACGWPVERKRVIQARPK